MRPRLLTAVQLSRWFAVRGIAIVATACLVTAIGCQGVMLSKMTSFREDKRILEQAKNDHFPSPADVGIEKPKDKP